MHQPNTKLSISLDAVVLDCPDVAVLSGFYSRLLGWKQTYDEGDEWVDLCSPCGGVKIAFQKNEAYVPPVWPQKSGEQRQMAHLDFLVGSREQMEFAVKHALDCGARLASVQYSDQWTTMIDPAGHPFCFVTDPSK